ncbi:hypothetical protein BSQ99_24695 [Serratia liquefaciens]|nr:hypothetical protein BSQ99_24695 [Serratia liquefaciens]
MKFVKTYQHDLEKGRQLKAGVFFRLLKAQILLIAFIEKSIRTILFRSVARMIRGDPRKTQTIN